MVHKAQILLLVLTFFTTISMAKYASVWQGSYTDSRYGGIAYFCVDDNDNLEGSYAEVGILQGKVNSSHAYGQWYMAGTADSSKRRMNSTLYTFNHGFSGYRRCMALDKDNMKHAERWKEDRVSPVIPTDYQCAKLNHTGSISYQWIDRTTNGPFWICFTRRGWESSYVRAISDGSNISVFQGYAEGSVVLNGVAGSGTWYENDGVAGAYLVFARSDGTLGTFKWTGLVGYKGATVINPFDMADPSRHSVETWYTTDVYPVHTQCELNEDEKKYVLKNLPEVKSGESFFFVSDSELFNGAFEHLFYSTFHPPVPSHVSDSSSSFLTFSFSLLILALLLV